MILTLINNKFINKSDAKVSIYSDAFQRGYGIFETLRTYGEKKLFYPKKHLKRLSTSAKAINLKIKYPRIEIKKMLEKVVAKSSHKIQRLKIIAIPEAIIITSIPYTPDLKLQKGVKVKSVNCQRSLPEVKSISYLASYLSHEQVAKLGYYDAIILDKSGEVYEGAYSNIFWFENDTLYTRKDEVLKGITREIILKISPFKIAFKNIKLKDLKRKKEIFLSQSTNGILPIIQIDNTKINQGKPGPNTNILINEFNKKLPK